MIERSQRHPHGLPASEGGTPVRSSLLPYGHHSISEGDVDAVVRVLRSGWLTTGPIVEQFEAAVARVVSARHAVAVSNGTAALHTAVATLGVGPGDEVIVPAMTFAATANCVVFQGGTPVIVDVDPDTLLLDPAAVEAHITPRSKALIAVDYAGHPCDYGRLAAVARRHGLALAADACHALGATYEGRPVGSLANLSVFSFHPVKHITTAEGGMVTTDDAGLAKRMRVFRNHGIDSDARRRQAEGQWYYEMVQVGYNYRLADLGCALGLSQLERLGSTLARRRAIAQAYTAAFQDVPEVIPPVARASVEHAWHIYPIRLDLGRLRVGRAEIFRALRAENIGVNVHYIPVHLHPFYRERFGYRPGRCPVAEDAYARLLTLPLFHGMSDEDVSDVITAVRKVLAYYAA